MVRSDQEYNSFQIIRPVIETSALKRFLEVADQAGRLIFSRDSENFEIIPDDILAGLETYAPQGNGSHSVDLAEHDVYSRNGLKLVLLDRRSPKTYKSQALLRAYARFDRPAASIRPKRNQRQRAPLPPALPTTELQQLALKYDIPDPSQLQLQFSQIVPVNDPADRKGGIEFALAPDPKEPLTQLIYEEAALCFSAFQALYHDLAFPTSKTTHQVSFVRTPEHAGGEQVSTFIEFLESRLPVKLDVGGIRPKHTD